VTLGAVRLKIIDLTGGDQPLASADGDSVIAFNGEIYNHAELRRELEARGHRFRTACDTEVVLEAFREWDVGCFPRLRGMFAAALWSEREKRLVLVRDRLGIKPLYIFRRGEDVYFGSELKAIFAHPEVPRELDLEALSYYLSLNYVPGRRTLAAGIEKLPPGHWLEWRHGQTRVERWWQLRFAPRKDFALAAAKEELDWLLRESVREHLVSDVPLGVWASGGLDSSTILHYAAEQSGKPLKTFSVSFRGRSFDESRYFREVARIYGTEHHEFDLNPEVELASAIEEFAYYSDEPGADAGALPVWYLSRMSRRHVTVALSGEGADELFGGYETYLADKLARPMRRLPERMRRLFARGAERYLPVSDAKIGFEYKLKRFLRGSAMEADAAHFFWNGAFGEDEKRRLCYALKGYQAGALVAGLEGAGELGGVNRYLYADQQYYLPDDILYKTDRMSMAHALEVRPPFLDHRIVEFAATLPENFKVRGLELKFLLKELMRDKLPAAIVRRKKTGFDIPAHEWFRGVLRPLLVETLTEPAARATGIFDGREIAALIRDHMDRRINAGYHLWGLLTLFLWMKRWRIEVLPAEASGEEAPVGAFATR
jgi:asparagine synthase (glutamine-hydrolysing)